MSDEKLQSILEWETSKNVKGVQAFLGFTHFYCRFIKSYSRICKPMTETTKPIYHTGGMRKCEGIKESKAAFKELKAHFPAAPILPLFDLTL